MSALTHTIISVLLLFVFHMWGYYRATIVERKEGMRECLFALQEMGVISNFKIETIDEPEEDEIN